MKMKVWEVVDTITGAVLFWGRKRDAVRYWYPRWCYGREPIALRQTDDWLTP